MRAWPQSFGFLICALCMCASSAGRADPTSSAQEAARAAFAEGERAFAKGAYAEATSSFETAFKLVSHDAVRFNIAVCLERQGRYREAWVQYKAASESVLLDESERKRAAQAAERTRRELGTLAVVGTAGEPVSIDGETRCSTPCHVELDPRAYEIVVGNNPARVVRMVRGEEVRLEASQAAFTVALPHAQEPKPADRSPTVGA